MRSATRRPSFSVRAGHRRARQRGQGLVEFALVLVPLMLLMVGIIQMGLIFNAYVTVANATREGARSATIYVYDRSHTKSWNDTERAAAARLALTNGMGLLQRTAPQLVTSEQTVVYDLPSGIVETDARVGQNVTIHAVYHMDIIIPMIGAILPLQGGRLTVDSQVTMVVN